SLAHYRISGEAGWRLKSGTGRLVVGRYRGSDKSDAIGGGPNAFVAEVDFGLAAMMCDMDVHGEEDFAAGKTTVRGVVHGVELGGGGIRDGGGSRTGPPAWPWPRRPKDHYRLLHK